MKNKKNSLPKIKNKLPAPKMKRPKEKISFEIVYDLIVKRYPHLSKEEIETNIRQVLESEAILCGKGCICIKHNEI